MQPLHTTSEQQQLEVIPLSGFARVLFWMCLVLVGIPDPDYPFRVRVIYKDMIVFRVGLRRVTTKIRFTDDVRALDILSPRGGCMPNLVS